MSGDALLAGLVRVAAAPSSVLFALGLGLLAGLGAVRPQRVRARNAVPAAVVGLAAGWLAGGLFATQRLMPDALTWIALASVPAIGASVALNASVRPRLLAALAAAGGALHGALGGAGGELVAAFSAAFGACVPAAVAAGAALLARGPRTRIAARVAGSWIAAIGLLLVAWQARPALAPRDEACASCVAAMLSNEWCDTCGVGWVASFEVGSRSLFEAIDAHGHDTDRDVMQCTACKRLMDEGGFCEACRIGWVDGQAYMSRLTYHLARGAPRALGDVDCATCDELSGGTGWCESCGGGWAGNVWLPDRADHADAVREIERLHAAIEASARCETCALVILVDGKCPYCRIRYAFGKPAETDGG